MTRLMRTPVFFALLCLAWSALGCSGSDSSVFPESAQGDGGSADEASSDSASDSDDGSESAAPLGRRYALASAGTQFVLQPRISLELTDASLAEDVDLFSIHQDFYGLPWDAFESGAEPPALWKAKMQQLKQAADQAGKGVFLSLQLVGGSSRLYLADKTVVTGGVLQKQEGWSTQCYDFASAPDRASKKAAYLAYVRWMMNLFRPRYVNVAIEMNMFTACGAAWDGLVEVEQAAYDAAKQVDPQAIVFPSIQLDFLYGYHRSECTEQNRAQCYEEGYAKIANLKRDRFAISTYPYSLDNVKAPSDLPSGWLTKAADRGGEKIVIAETGWNTETSRATYQNQCVEAIESDEEKPKAYLEMLLALGEQGKADLITWWSNRDLIPRDIMTSCECESDGRWCDIIELFRQLQGADPSQQYLGEMMLKIWGNMGIRMYDGTPKTVLFERWKQAQNKPWNGPPS